MCIYICTWLCMYVYIYIYTYLYMCLGWSKKIQELWTSWFSVHFPYIKWTSEIDTYSVYDTLYLYIVLPITVSYVDILFILVLPSNLAIPSFDKPKQLNPLFWLNCVVHDPFVICFFFPIKMIKIATFRDNPQIWLEAGSWCKKAMKNHPAPGTESSQWRPCRGTIFRTNSSLDWRPWTGGKWARKP